MLIEVKDMTTGFINRTIMSINFLNLETEFYKILPKNIIQASHHEYDIYNFVHIYALCSAHNISYILSMIHC